MHCNAQYSTVHSPSEKVMHNTPSPCLTVLDVFNKQLLTLKKKSKFGHCETRCDLCATLVRMGVIAEIKCLAPELGCKESLLVFSMTNR